MLIKHQRTLFYSRYRKGSSQIIRGMGRRQTRNFEEGRYKDISEIIQESKNIKTDKGKIPEKNIHLSLLSSFAPKDKKLEYDLEMSREMRDYIQKGIFFFY